MFYFSIIALFLQLNLVACARDCHWEYYGNVEYNVESITVKEYDATNSSLSNEYEAYSVDQTQENFTGYLYSPIESIAGLTLSFVGTISSSQNISIEVKVGEQLEEMEIGETVNDNTGSYLELESFYLPLEVENIKYELDDLVTVSKTNEGYQAIVRKYPYVENDDGEVEYYDTLEATIVFDNVAIDERHMNQTFYCRN